MLSYIYLLSHYNIIDILYLRILLRKLVKRHTIRVGNLAHGIT